MFFWQNILFWVPISVFYPKITYIDYECHIDWCEILKKNSQSMERESWFQ